MRVSLGGACAAAVLSVLYASPASASAYAHARPADASPSAAAELQPTQSTASASATARPTPLVNAKNDNVSVQFIAPAVARAENPFLVEILALNSTPETRPSLVALIEHEAMLEKMFLLPARVLDDERVEFRPKIIVPGRFHVTLWVEGSLKIHWNADTWKYWPKSAWDEPNLNKVPWYDKAPFRKMAPLSALIQFSFDVAASTETELVDYFGNNLRTCTVKDFGDLQTAGKWVSPRILKSPALDLPQTQGRGADLSFFPEKCRLRYRSVPEAQQCLHRKTVAFVGDSTFEELLIDLVSHVFGDDPTSDEFIDIDPYVAVSTEQPDCNQRRRREFSASGVFKELHSFTRLSMIWGPQLAPCGFSVGNGTALSLFNDPLHVERLLFKLRFSASINKLPYVSDEQEIPFRLAAPLIYGWERHYADLIVFGSGLHDMEDFGPEGSVYTIEDYPAMIEKALHLLKTENPRALIVFLTTNTKIAQSNFYIRHINDAGKAAAHKLGIPVIDANGIQKHRLRGDLSWHFGDYHHSTNFRERSPFSHAVVQMILNALCPWD
ncbi:hypothetical protein HDU84_000487 [Entophlyctis sp. JEL0112]|nr:hypothetical protein HDU84_000487 [Entophlyctis sp. JEL0112]